MTLHTATITLDGQGLLTDRSTVTITDPDNNLVDAAQVLPMAEVGGRMAPRRIHETLQDMGWRRVSDWTRVETAIICRVEQLP
jgi:hypothetical protein